jgi:hypothetical protein
MLSVVIPTLWRSPYILDLVEYLNAIDEIGEIIIIDNEKAKTKNLDLFTKVIHVKNPENNFVSPSWNQGVGIAKYNKICLLNDDIIIHKDIFILMDNFISESVGLVGLSSDVYENCNEFIENLERPRDIKIHPVSRRNFGYGCCMFIHKNNYKIIPNEMKIQYGDDYIFYSLNRINYVIDGFSIVGKISASLLNENLEIIDKEFINNICQTDHNVFWNEMEKDVLKRTPLNSFECSKLQELEKYKWKSSTNYYFD